MPGAADKFLEQLKTLGEKLAVDAQVALRPLAPAISAALGPVADAVRPFTQQVGDVAGRLAELKEKLGVDARVVLGPLSKAVGEVAAGVSAAASAVGSAVSGVTSAVGGAGKAAAGALQLVAAPISLFKDAGEAVKGFAGALNPTSVVQFERALESIQAVVGVALQPVLEAATGVMRDFAATMLPVAQQLRPVIQALSESLGKVAATSVNAFGAILTALVPLMEFFAGVIDGLTPILRAFSATVAGGVEVVATLFRSLLKALNIDADGALDGFKSAMEQLAQAAILANVALLKFVDELFDSKLADAFVGGVRKAFGDGVEKKDASGLPAARNAQVSDLSSFSKTLSQAAFLAGPGGTQSKEDRFRDQVLKSLDEVAKSSAGETLKKIEAKLDEISKKLGGQLYDGAKERIKEAATKPYISPLGYAASRLGIL